MPENGKAKKTARRNGKLTRGPKTAKAKGSLLSDIIETPTPETRPLKCYAFDPSQGKFFGNEMTLEVKYEKLLPGPIGERIAVIDYDGENKKFYKPVDLDNPNLLIRAGLNPTESNPCFHQQMVYSLASRGASARCQRQNTSRPARRRHLSPEFISPRNGLRQCGLFTCGKGNSFWLLSRQHVRSGTQSPRTDSLHLSIARHHRPRGYARNPRRHSHLLLGTNQFRRSGFSRSLRGYRCVVSTLLPQGSPARYNPEDRRQALSIPP